MKPAFGLDLAGYTSGTSGFARADREPGVEIRITVYRDNPFNVKLTGREPLSRVAHDERRLIEACIEAGTLLVDTPIDLQGLPRVAKPEFGWELTRRPVDYAFGALAALADRIGAPVARFQQFLDGNDGRVQAALGRTLFETYPAASLRLLHLPATGYKRKTAVYDGFEWKQHRPGHQPLAALLNRLEWTADAKEVLNDDELDAALCALAGAVDAKARLEGKELEDTVRHHIAQRLGTGAYGRFRADPPCGYVLLKLPPLEPVTIRVVRAATFKRFVAEMD